MFAACGPSLASRPQRAHRRLGSHKWLTGRRVKPRKPPSPTPSKFLVGGSMGFPTKNILGNAFIGQNQSFYKGSKEKLYPLG